MNSIPKLEIKSDIRTITIENVTLGGDRSVTFMSENDNKTSTKFALEVPYILEENYPIILRKLWEDKEFKERIQFANSFDCDFISIKFNVSEDNIKEEIIKIRNLLPEIFQIAEKPLILRGANIKNVDKQLLPELAKNAPKKSIIAFADDMTYNEIASATAKYGHLLVLRSPIDINLAKELNIQAKEMGMSLDSLLIDPDMGALGYGLDYGYSIVEKIKLSALEGDNLLNMPIIVFAGEEAFKAKEAKSSQFNSNWGEYEARAKMWEISTVMPMISAGANIVVIWHPETISTLKGALK